MEFAQALKFYGAVLVRGIRDTGKSFGVWTLVLAPIGIAVAIGVHVALGERYPDLKQRLGDPMTRWWLWIVYTLAPMGAIALLTAIYNVFVAPYRIHRDQADKIERLTPPKLNLFFETPGGGVSPMRLSYVNVTVTNRSECRMNLQFVAIIDYFRDDGEPSRLTVVPYWKPDLASINVNVELESKGSALGELEISLPLPAKHGVERWNLRPSKNIYIEASDSVSGERIVFKAIPGHPKGEMPCPLPPVKELLAPRALAETRPNPSDQPPSPESAP